ncbi:hypothetical protein C7M84_022895 [Penaeus vannamei]|uniref:Uncharacterized protein n=1 Tax=Penaeus vannamei TaxID=6689 RepID=A0A3R7PVK6_PENVA|nr:hypothetical protein C7M84_022895 [Penaeus vannamei]
MAVRQLNQKRFFRRITFIGDHFRGNTPPPLGMTTPSYPRLSLAFLLSPVILYFLPSSSSLSPLFGLFLFLLSRPSFSSLSFYVSPFFLFFPFLLFFVPSLSSDSRLSFRSPFIFFSVFLFSFSSVPSFSSLSLPSSFFLPSYSSLFYFFLPCFSSLSFLSLLNVVFLPFLPFLSFLSLFFLFSPSSSSSLSFLSILYPFFLLFIPFSALSLLSLLSPLFFSLSSSASMESCIDNIFEQDDSALAAVSLWNKLRDSRLRGNLPCFNKELVPPPPRQYHHTSRFATTLPPPDTLLHLLLPRLPLRRLSHRIFCRYAMKPPSSSGQRLASPKTIMRSEVISLMEAHKTSLNDTICNLQRALSEATSKLSDVIESLEFTQKELEDSKRR